MPKKDSLKDFVEGYIAAKEKANKSLGFADWLKENRIKSQSTASLRGAAGELLKSKSNLGATAERLAQMGLSSGGYAERMKKLRTDAASKRLFDGRSAILSSKEDARTDYRSYLAKNPTTNGRVFRSTVNSIKDSSIIDYDTAYFYAIGAGLSESDAKAAATAATDAVKRELRVSISKSIISKKLTESEAREYAASLGFSKDEIEDIASYAKRVNELISSGDISYEDYLGSLEKDD